MPRFKTARTAVVVVHGMGEQLPLETLNRFVRTALPPFEGERRYFSRPERVTGSYEARRHLAYRQPFHGGPLLHGQTEVFEYHWSYQMSGNKLGDLLPTFRRLLLQRPSRVPEGLKVMWVLVWLLLLALLAVLVAILSAGVVIEEFTVVGIITALAGQGLLTFLLLQLVNRTGNAVTKSFVDVVRYLDRSPRSYEVRRNIRKGMVELLQGIHDKGRYSRVVVVGHSLGAFIAYDAIAYLWPQMSKLHCGPPDDRADYVRLPTLPRLEAAAIAIANHPLGALADRQSVQLEEFRSAQFELWRDLRRQGNPWLITDLVTVGTPMYFADQLFTKNREQFNELVKRAELPVCPPRDGDQTVEGPDSQQRRYGYNNRGREVLVHGAPFAVTRWTNMWFPAENHWRGDWFGGPLRPLFGTGILDIPLLGNLPERRTPAVAHSRYFNYPDRLEPQDSAAAIQRTLRLDIDDQLIELFQAPAYDKLTDVTT